MKNKSFVALYKDAIKEHRAKILKDREFKKEFFTMYKEAISEYKTSFSYKQRQKKQSNL